MVRERIVIIFLLSCIVLLAIAKIAITEFIDQFDDTVYLQKEYIQNLTTKNAILEEKILQFESYTKIASEAATRGYR